MAQRTKLGDLRGVQEWRNLESPGDVRRFLKWCIHSIRNQTLEPKTAAIMAQIGSYLLKAVETESLDERVAALEAQARALTEQQGNGAAWQ
jgi:hypothetical protein